MRTAIAISIVVLMLLYQASLCQTTEQRIASAVEQISVSSVSGYVVCDMVNVDSAIGNLTVADGRIEDPYGTLAGCDIFTVRGRRQDDHMLDPRGFVGVWKNERILWTSDTLMDSFLATSPQVFATTDLNHDGSVDILIAWGVDAGSGHTKDYLWIFSWDGSRGTLISDHDSLGRSAIVSIDQAFKIADMNGDGIKEIRVNLSGNYSNFGDVVYSWNGKAYGRWPDAPHPSPGSFLPRNRLKIALTAGVTNESNSYTYNYRVHNNSTSIQDLSEINFSRSSSDYVAVASPNLWNFDLGDFPIYGWSTVDVAAVVEKGKTLGGFAVKSQGLPGIISYYAQGFTDVSPEPDHPDAWFHNVITNSDHGFTIGPIDAQLQYNNFVFLDTLLSYTGQSADLGWLGRDRDNDCDDDERQDDGVAKNIEKRLEKAKKFLERDDSLKARRELEKLVQKVERIWKRSQDQDKKRGKDKEWKQDKGLMTSEAYALLKYNTKYLIDHLSDKQPKRGKTRERE